MNKPIPWSYSAWAAYQKCPRQYLEVRVRKSVQDKTFQSISGDNQHAAYEAAIKTGAPLPANMAHQQPYIDLIQAMPGTKYAEMQLAINPQTQACGYWDDNVWLRAKADVVIENGDQITVYDWKTGKSKYADTNQLKITAQVLFSHKPHVNEIRAALLFTTENIAIPATYTREERGTYWSHLLPTYRDMVNSHISGHYVAKKSGLCKTCPVKTCEFWRGHGQ